MSDSDDAMIDNSELYDFTLIQFIHKGKKRKIEEVDIVPSKWLQFDKIRGRCVTKFPPKPYGDGDIKILHNLTKNLADAPEDWPTFSVVLKGRASETITQFSTCMVYSNATN